MSRIGGDSIVNCRMSKNINWSKNMKYLFFRLFVHLRKTGVNVIGLCVILCICSISLCSYKNKEVGETNTPRIVNIINFIRLTEPRPNHENATDEALYGTVVKQMEYLKQYNLKATFLLQYDALVNSRYEELMKEASASGSEIGGWWEITQPHAEAAGLKWRGKYSWDSHAHVDFSIGYTRKEREKLVDVYMAKFKQIFGKYPSSVGSWMIDAHTLKYMYDKYHVIASCNCREQVGTDGYTLWGGYWGQGYYPSKENEFMPAQSIKGQIPVPVFRMLGNDPIYQYDNYIKGGSREAATLEPVYLRSGGSEKWVNWFFKSMFEDPCLGFNYLQAGQENSFTWKSMQRGYELQIPLIATYLKQGKIRVETLGETGRWYRAKYRLTPAAAVSALTDYKDNGKKSVWYNSRFYRANLLWEGSSCKLRDIYLFSEKYPSNYIIKPDTSHLFVYKNLPFVDGCQWSSLENRAGIRFYIKQSSGEMKEVAGKLPVISTKGDMLKVIWPSEEEGTSFVMSFYEGEMVVKCVTKNKSLVWNMKLTTLPGAALPFTKISDRIINACQRNFVYSVRCLRGQFKDCRANNNGDVFTITPSANTMILDFSQISQ